MGLIETEGIILKTHPIGDADKIVVAFTPTNGIVRGVAKGAKRLRSRFGGSLEPFSIVDMDLFQKEDRELVSIRRIDLKKSFFEISGDSKYFQLFSYLSELLFEFIPANEANERIYKMSCVCLETASEFPTNLESIALYFEGWLLKLSGYLPSWESCNICNRDLRADPINGLLPNFQLICENCRKQGNHFAVTKQTRQMLIELQKSAPESFIRKTENSTDEVKKLSEILKRIISHITNKDIAAQKLQISY